MSCVPKLLKFSHSTWFKNKLTQKKERGHLAQKHYTHLKYVWLQIESFNAVVQNET